VGALDGAIGGLLGGALGAAGALIVDYQRARRELRAVVRLVAIELERNAFVGTGAIIASWDIQLEPLAIKTEVWDEYRLLLARGLSPLEWAQLREAYEALELAQRFTLERAGDSVSEDTFRDNVGRNLRLTMEVASDLRELYGRRRLRARLWYRVRARRLRRP